ncbi:ABC transporter substrate-binding protein [Conexibacter woesei]|uniref:Extracellular solute-binding protein family 5 n=1 Tax=Conexibacter woesei (strain DSM 14684 / CCUG 47730 / CIP 108061 / JCM 11494 / NBRC 100937 / ID131577) TaxID=469383 RepID=D3F1S6_CONWI|nr:ABC transporter substrate-binding protein [Conexibacter woesei]ADB54107.1 extracellular solute-binding protein family 5 [Conexibacter woesei DSM 14684]
MESIRKRPLAAIAACALLAAGTTACGGATRSSSSTQGGGTTAGGGVALSDGTPAPAGDVDKVTWAVYAEPASLDWAFANDFPPLEIGANVCESLSAVTPEMEIVPALATGWRAPNPKTLVYTLRDGVRFHSGAPLTSEDVAYSLGRNLDRSVGSYYAGAYANVSKIEATGPNEVTIKLERPDAQLPSALATPAGRIESKAFLEQRGRSYGTPEGGIDCTGPFSFGSWTKGQSVTLERFDGYWDAERVPKIAQLEVDFIADPAARVNALASGTIDGTYQVPTSGFKRLGSSPTGTLSFGRAAGSYVAMVTSLDGPLRDVRIRRALSLAINRDGIISSVLDGAAEPLKAPVAPGAWGYAKETYRAAYDALPEPSGSVEEAKRLVQEAGAPSEPITVAITRDREEMPTIAAEMQRAAREIGLQLEIKSLAGNSYNALYSDAKARDGVDMLFSQWVPDFPDPLQLYQYMRGDNFYGYARWEDPDFMRLTSEAAGTADEEQRARLIAEAQERAVEAQIWIPLYTPYNPVFLNKRITGAPTSAVNLTYSWAADLGATG